MLDRIRYNGGKRAAQKFFLSGIVDVTTLGFVTRCRRRNSVFVLLPGLSDYLLHNKFRGGRTADVSVTYKHYFFHITIPYNFVLTIDFPDGKENISAKIPSKTQKHASLPPRGLPALPTHTRHIPPDLLISGTW